MQNGEDFQKLSLLIRVGIFILAVSQAILNARLESVFWVAQLSFIRI